MSGDQQALQAIWMTLPECPPLEDLVREASSGGGRFKQHADACPRCSSEMALYAEFMDGAAVPDLDACVETVNRRLPTAPRHQKPVNSWLAWLFRPMVFAPAAALAVALAVIGVGIQQNAHLGPALPQEAVYRAQTVELLAPKGDVPEAPAALRWNAVPAAVTYKVKVMEVDRNVIWQATSQSSVIALPASVRSKALPGKRLIWTVEALDGRGQSLCSGSQDFRRSIAR